MMTDKLRAAAQAALKWLRDEKLNQWTYMDGSQFYADRDKQAEALEVALAEQTVKESLTVAEPVAWKHPNKNMVFWEDTKEVDEYHGFKSTIPLYTAPPRREWVGLTDADFEKEKFVDYNFMAGASFAEAKLKDKNCG